MYRVLLCALVGLLAGCSTFTDAELAYLQSRNVPPPVLRKLERGDSLTPPEIVSLSKRGVPDRFTIRHLEDNGVDYLVTRNDIVRMRNSGVSAVVIDVLLAECDSFARDYAASPVDVDVGFWWASSPYFARDVYYPMWW
jgi:hypothetical protein